MSSTAWWGLCKLGYNHAYFPLADVLSIGYGSLGSLGAEGDTQSLFTLAMKQKYSLQCHRVQFCFLKKHTVCDFTNSKGQPGSILI